MQRAGRPEYDDFPHRTYVLLGRTGCCFLDVWGVGKVKKKTLERTLEGALEGTFLREENTRHQKRNFLY